MKPIVSIEAQWLLLQHVHSLTPWASEKKFLWGKQYFGKFHP